MDQPRDPFDEHIFIDEPWHLKKDFSELLAIITDIASELSLDELLTKVMQHAISLCDADFGSIIMLDDSGNISQRYDYQTPSSIRFSDMQQDRSAFLEILQNKGPIIINNYSSYPTKIETFVGAGVKAILAAPVISKDAVIAVTWVYSTNSQHRFTDYHSHLLEAVCLQAGVAIENARLYESQSELQKETAEALKTTRALLEVTRVIGSTYDPDQILKTLSDEVAEITGFRRNMVFIYNPENQRHEIKAGYNISLTKNCFFCQEFGRELCNVYETASEVVVSEGDPELSAEIRATMTQLNIKLGLIVPMAVGSRIIGSVVIDDPGKDTPFSEREVELAKALATQAAVAVDNARLFTRLRESTRELSSRSRDLQTLLDVALNVTEGLKLDELMYRIARNATKITGSDVGAVGLIDEHGNVTYPFVYNLPEVIKEVVIPPGFGMTGIVVRERHSVVAEDYQELAEKIEAFAAAGLRSIAMVPLWLRDQVTGALWVSSKNSSKRYSQRDVTILEALGRHAAIALENSRLFEAQRHIAESLQKSMLPARLPQIDGIEIGVRYLSATEEALVGGDFYDVYEAGGKFAFVIGDVSGKGIEAASSTSMVKYVLQSYLYQSPSPAFVLTEANKVIVRQIEHGVFITVFCAVYDPKTGALTFSNAGHPHPCLLGHLNKTCTVLATEDPAVGIIDDYKYSENAVVMKPGDTFTAFTDGVLETRYKSEFFGEKRLVEVLIKNIETPAQKIADSIIHACFAFSHGHLTDDIAILVAKRVG